MRACLQIDELKAYFEDPDDDEEFHDPYAPGRSAELLILSKSVPRNKDDLLALLPDKRVIDRLMLRYFNSNSPSQRECFRAFAPFAVQADLNLRYPSHADLWQGVQ